MRRHLTWLTTYAVAMAYVESAAVVYLRGIYYPHGFEFPLTPMSPSMAAIEIGREAAPIVMLLGVAALAGEDRWERFLAFCFSFGVWDLFYYGWLWTFIRWPPSLFTWDVLFLIPVPWAGPVLAPVLISVALGLFNLLPVPALDGGRLVPDPRNAVAPDTSVSARRWHRVLGDLHNRIRVLQLARIAQQANWRNALVWSRTTAPVAEPPRPAGYMNVWPYRPPATADLAKAWDTSEAILVKMIDSAREHNAEFWLVQLGNDIEEDARDSVREEFLRVNQLQDFRYAAERYRAFAASHRIFYVDLAPPMLEHSRRTGKPLRGFFNSRPYKGHWNEAGNAEAASIIGGELLKKSRALAVDAGNSANQ